MQRRALMAMLGGTVLVGGGQALAQAPARTFRLGTLTPGIPIAVDSPNGKTLLAKLAQPVERAIQLDVDNELLIARLAGRALAEGRADDNPESVRKRLQVYNDSTAPVIGFYAGRGTLTAIDGVGSMDEITARVLAALRS